MADEKKKSYELLPPENDKNVGFRVFEILSSILAEKEDQGLPDKWSRNYALGKGRHWKRKSKHVSLITANMLGTHRTRTTNLLTDNNPTFNVRKAGRYEEDSEDFQMLVHTTENWWRETEQQQVYEWSVMNGETYGCTIEKVLFNPDAEHGIGEVETHNVDPFYFGIYPVKTVDNQKGEANLHFYPKSVREVKRMFPEKADKISSDKNVLKTLNDTRREVSEGKGKPGWLSTFSNVVKSVTETVSTSADDEDEVLVVECWVKDYTMEVIETSEPIMVPVIDPVTEEPLPDQNNPEEALMEQAFDDEGVPMFVTEERPKYPGFVRCVTVCSGGDVVLKDVPNPSINPELDREDVEKCKLYDEFPFNCAQSGTDTASFWGISDLEQLEQLQKEVNKSLSQFTMLKDKAARLKLINPKTSGVENSSFDNVPGIIRPMNEIVAAAIRYMDPPKIPPDIMTAIDIYRDLFHQVAGSAVLEQAQSQTQGDLAYKAIAALIEQASTMLRGKIRNYSKLIRNRGRMYLSHVMNWYTEERWVSFEQDREEMSKPVVGVNFVNIPGKLTVVSGSTLPISKVQEREEALALAQMGQIDQEELLKKLEWPNYREVLQRMMQGPLSSFLGKLSEMGWPEELVNLFSQVSQIPDKEFKNAKEEIPSFEDIVQQIQGLPEENTDKDDAEVLKTLSETEKIEADKQLVLAKIKTEIVDQEVKKAGIGFDQEKLKIDKAQVVANINREFKRLRLDEDSLKADTILKGADIKAKREIETKKVEAAKVKSSKEKGQGPYSERGMKSNNKEV